MSKDNMELPVTINKKTLALIRTFAVKVSNTQFIHTPNHSGSVYS